MQTNPADNNLRKELLSTGAHLGHQKRKWNPKMSPYIYNESNGIHLIDLNKTVDKMQNAAKFLKQVAKSGKKILFVATKKQAKGIVKSVSEELGIHFVTERWLGGMLTNFVTIRKSVKKMQNIEKILADTEVTTLTKKEKLTMERDKQKIKQVLGGVSTLNTVPGCVFLVDLHNEHIALAEAKKLGVPTVAIVDTNCDPNDVDYPIPANDDSTRTITLITQFLAEAIKEGLAERKVMQTEKETEQTQQDSQETPQQEARPARRSNIGPRRPASSEGGRRPSSNDRQSPNTK